MKKPAIIILTSDFGLQSQGTGNMEGIIAEIAPHARVIHLMHGLASFDLRSGPYWKQFPICLLVFMYVLLIRVLALLENQS